MKDSVKKSLWNIGYFAVLAAAAWFSVQETAYPLYGVLAVFFGVTLWREGWVNARAVLYLSAFLLTQLLGKNFPLYLGLADLAVCSVTALVTRPGVGKRSLWVLGSYAVFLLIGTASSLFCSADRAAALEGVIGYIAFLGIIAGNELYPREKKLKWSVVQTAGLTVALVFMVWFWRSNSLASLWETNRGVIRLFGESGARSNSLAGFLLPVYILSVYSLFDGCWVRRAAAGLCAAAMTAALAFLQSRGTMVALAAALAYFVLRSAFLRRLAKKLGGKRLLAAAAGALAALVLAFFLLPENWKALLVQGLSRFISIGTEDLTNGRLALLVRAGQEWLKHPVIGNGFLQFHLYTHVEVGDPHNFIVGYLASVGVLGTAAFCLFLYHTVRLPKARRGDPRLLALQTMVLAQCVHALFEPVLTTTLPIGLFLTTCMLLRRCEGKAPRREKPGSKL